MAKFVILLLSLAVIQTSLALKCKTCTPPCTTMTDQTCSTSAKDREPACLTYIYKENANAKEEMTEKKCVDKPKDKKYDCIPQPNEVEVKCETCMTDLCNEKSGASNVNMGVLAVVGFVVAVFAPKFL